MQAPPTTKQGSKPATLPETQRRRRARRHLKRLGLVLGSIFLLFTALLVALYFALRDPWLYQKLSPYLAKRLEPLGIELTQPGSLQIDVLRSVTLRDLQVSWRDPDIGTLELTLGALDLHYYVNELLKGELKLEDLAIRDAQIRATLNTTQSQPLDTSQSSLSLNDLDALLSRPPLPVSIKQLALQRIALQLSTGEGTQWQRLSGQLKQATGAFSWQSKGLSGALKLEVDQPWQFALEDEKGRMTLDFMPQLQSRLQWQLDHEAPGWHLARAGWDQTLNLRKLELTRVHNGVAQSLAQAEQFSMQFKAQASTQNDHSTLTGLRQMFPLQVDADLKTHLSGLRGFALESVGLKLQTLAEQDLNLSLQGLLQPFAAGEPPLSWQVSQHLQFQELDAAVQGHQLTSNGLHMTLKGQGEVPSQLQSLVPLKFAMTLEGDAPQLVWQQLSAASDTAALQASLKPAFQLQASGVVPSLKDPLRKLQMKFAPRLTADGLVVSMARAGERSVYRADQERFGATGSLDQGQLSLLADLQVDGLHLPELLDQFSLQNQIDLQTGLDFKQPTVQWKTQLDGRPLLAMDLKGNNQPGNFTLAHQINGFFDTKLKRLHPAAEMLDRLGNVEIQWNGAFKLKHGVDSIVALDFSKFSHWRFADQGQIQWRQTRPPVHADGLQLSGPLKVDYGIEKQGARDYSSELRLATRGIQFAPLVKPVPFVFSQRSHLDWPLTSVESRGDLKIAGNDAASYKLQATNLPKHFDFDTHWSFSSQPEWQVYAPMLAALDSIGAVTGEHQLKGTVAHPYRSLLDFEAAQLQQLKADVTLDSQFTQASDQRGRLLQIFAPVDVHQQVHWSAGAANLKGRYHIAAAKVLGQMTLEDFGGQYTLNADSGLTPDGGKIDLQVSTGSLLLHETDAEPDAAANMKNLLVPFNLNITARQAKQKVLLENLSLQTGDRILDLQASGEAGLDGKNAQLYSTLRMRLQPDLLQTPYLSGAGTIQIPWQLILLNGDQLSIDGDIRFDQLDLATQNWQIQGLNGGLHFEEELLWTGERLKYRYLRDPDPFQRVDFSRVQPFLQDRVNLSVMGIATAEQSIGPGLVNLQLQQNVLNLRQLDLQLFGGHITGRLYVDTRPGNWQIGLLSRITEVDPRQLLRQGSALREGVYAPLSARTAVTFDIRRRLLEGRIDVTKINREQLYQLLEVLDPDYEDEQLAALRAALRIAHPEQVSINMHQGLLDLEARISALPQPLRIKGLPLTPLIQYFAGVALEALGNVPLE